MCARRLGIEIRLFGRRAVEQEPADGICHRGLARAVRAVDIRVLAVKVDGKVLDAAKVFQLKPQDFHDASTAFL